MSRFKRGLVATILAVTVLAVMPGVANAYYLLGASLDPDPVAVGDPLTVEFVLGDDMIWGAHPYEVEAWFGDKGPAEAFNCGLTFGYSHTTLWHSPAGLFPPSWNDRYTDFNTAGLFKVFEAAYPGAPSGTVKSFSFIPSDYMTLEVGKTYWVHLLVGYPTECENWTHYSLPFTVKDGEPGPPVFRDGITGTNATWADWEGKLITQKPGNKSGVMYWAVGNSGGTTEAWKIMINDAVRAGDFYFRGNNSDVQVFIDGSQVASYEGPDWIAAGRTHDFGNLPPDTEFGVRVKMEYKVPNDLPQIYTFSSQLTGSMSGDAVLSRQLLVTAK